MSRLAILTGGAAADLSTFAKEDHALARALEDRGWSVDLVAWDRQHDWSAFDAALIRGTWDYHVRLAEYLTAIRAVSCPLANDAQLVAWNADKRYLLELAAAGVPTVPTREVVDTASLRRALVDWNSTQAVAKPCVGASAHGVRVVTSADQVASPILLQPFVKSIQTEGETSLMYFGEVFSHAMNKRPADGDFRVQEELGGQSRLVEPDEAQLQVARRALDALPVAPLYARVDLVDFDGPVVMEIELIEPVLYLSAKAGALERFAGVVNDWARPVSS